MQTFQLKVGPDGRVEIPNTRPGEIVTIQVAREVEARVEGTGPIPEEDREEIKKQVLQLALKIRKGLSEPWLSSDHGDLLYGDDGLPS